jgi:hypothetical protein
MTYRRGKGFAWTEPQVCMLYQAIAEGLTAGGAARRIGKSRDAIRAKAKLLGLSFIKVPRMVRGQFPEWTKQDIMKLRSLLQEKPLREVAREMGRTPRAIRAKACRLGIPLAGGVVTIREAAGILGLAESTVRAAMRRLGIDKRMQCSGSRYFKNPNGLVPEEIEELAKAFSVNLNVKAPAKQLREVAAGNFEVRGLSETLRDRRRAQKSVQL